MLVCVRVCVCSDRLSTFLSLLQLVGPALHPPPPLPSARPPLSHQQHSRHTFSPSLLPHPHTKERAFQIEVFLNGQSGGLGTTCTGHRPFPFTSSRHLFFHEPVFLNLPGSARVRPPILASLKPLSCIHDVCCARWPLCCQSGGGRRMPLSVAPCPHQSKLRQGGQEPAQKECPACVCVCCV